MKERSESMWIGGGTGGVCDEKDGNVGHWRTHGEKKNEGRESSVTQKTTRQESENEEREERERGKKERFGVFVVICIFLSGF